MKPKTEELLYLLLWTADRLMRPTFRNLTDSFETWAYRNGLLRQIHRLEKAQLIEAREDGSHDRVYRLTNQGRLCALGGRDPEVRWSRTWDGRWRVVLFDVPVTQDTLRTRLRRYLRDRGFGCLQGSVWVTPDPLEEERQTLAGTRVDVASMLLLDAQPCAGESDEAIVEAGWNFQRINQRYQRLMKILDERPKAALKSEGDAKALLRWAVTEREAWRDAVTHDPLLPKRILPAAYLGRKAWQHRVEVLRESGALLEQYQVP